MVYENLFVFFSIGMIFCMLCVLLLKNAVLSVVSLIGFFLNGSAMLFFFRSEYLGIVYIVVYVGAIAVLFLFVVMMLDFKSGSLVYDYKSEYFISSSFFIFLFFLYLFNFFFKSYYIEYNLLYYKSSYVYKSWVSFINSLTDMASIGSVLYTYYYIFLFVSGLLLFIAMLGAIVLTLFKREGVKVQSLSSQVLRSTKLSVFYYNKN